MNRPTHRLAAIALAWFLIAGMSCGRVPLVVCLPLKERSPEFNAQLADELESLPPTAATIDAIAELISLRDQIRACREGQ